MTEPKDVPSTTPPRHYRVAGDPTYAPAVKLYSAAYALYTSARWTTDTLTDDEQAKLWEALRDALHLPLGTATELGVDRG